MIDNETYADLMRGIFTCYWCGGKADKYEIGDHVDNCLKEIRGLNQEYGDGPTAILEKGTND